MVIRQIFFLSLLIFPAVIFSQEKEDPAKMFRDIVPLEVDRAKYAPKPAVVAAPPVDPKSKKKKKVEEPVEPPVDTLPPMMPAPADEILKRAQHWYTVKSTKYVKANGSNTGKSVLCNVTFVYKQKILNPENDVDGKITMDVVVDAKEGKYRYTIKNIKHKANKQGMSGGDVYGTVPEAGSMNISDRTWKHIRAEAFANAQKVIDDLKATMKEEVSAAKDDW
jgi:hypothetical protein